MAKSPKASGRPILAIDSAWDPATKTVAEYRKKKLYPYFSKQGLKLTRLAGRLAMRILFRVRAQRKAVLFITGMGHGSERVFTGHDCKTLLEVGNYAAQEVENKIIHLLSCKTGAELGPDTVKNGAIAFFGYAEDFIFVEGREGVFFECDCEIDRAIAEGLTVAEVHDRVVARFEYEIDVLAAQDDLISGRLNANLQCLRSPVTSKLFGRRNAKLRRT